ncbi:Outer membrane protein A [Paraburkholderia saeva]|uniref:Outer membrane protein A n=2 Tax=Paraburkholderia saeva TaxID=2777537 RepID=A0A9N8RVQ7_9BURK|nr:Outer membrane protein A [Paraburkholderia saeva]
MMGKIAKLTRTGSMTPLAMALAVCIALAGCGSSPPPPPPPVSQAPAPAPAPEAPPPAPAPTHEHYTLAGGATFNSGQAKLRPSADVQLDKIIAHVQHESVQTVTVTGYTDSVGSSESNHQLSLRRAQAVAHYLQEHGLKANEYVVHGNGESDPVDTNDTEQGRAQNRRVEIDVVGG